MNDTTSTPCKVSAQGSTPFRRPLRVSPALLRGCVLCHRKLPDTRLCGLTLFPHLLALARTSCVIFIVFILVEQGYPLLQHQTATVSNVIAWFELQLTSKQMRTVSVSAFSRAQNICLSSGPDYRNSPLSTTCGYPLIFSLSTANDRTLLFSCCLARISTNIRRLVIPMISSSEVDCFARNI